MDTRADIMEVILDLELEMFVSVPSDGVSPCQQNPEAFKIHRSLQFSVWSAGTLSHYMADLQHAKQNGENLMTRKYAYIQGLIPQWNTNPLIDTIIRIKMDWQADMMRRFPAIMGKARPLESASDGQWMTSFETYTRGELETYSDATLTSLYADIQTMLAQGINASERIYRLQAEQSGFSSLEAAEFDMQKKKNTKENKNGT